MDYRCLGTTGLHVSPICVGSMNFGPPFDRDACIELVHHALDRGVNFFDTANIYEGYTRTFGSAGGVAESILGEALRSRRHEVVVMTKLGNPNGTGPLNAGLSSRHLCLELDRSLQRLGMDHVDILLCHRADVSVSCEQTWNTLNRFVEAGKARVVGVSNWPAWRLAQACEVARRYGWAPCAVSSPQYSLLARQVELEHLPACAHYQVAALPYRGLAGGLLTGKYTRSRADLTGTRAGDQRIPPPDERLLDQLEAYATCARQAGLTMTELAIAWLLSRSAVDGLILGFRDARQLDAAIAAAGKTIRPADAEAVEQIFKAPVQPDQQVLRWRGHQWVLEDSEM